jgi:7,8-dihydropterin-6-yl-methyl-4-(beta-D-ribofuranosyl)aminobenzene 5'-phosphate synthase
MKITTLIENHVSDNTSDLTAEHGLSLHIERDIERDGHSILFDTGATSAFSDNAAKLGVILSTVDLVVLSHHHYDHGGGLTAFLANNDHASAYLRSPDDGEPYVRAYKFIRRYIGLDEKLFQKYADRFVFVDQFTEIAPGVFLFAEIVQAYPRPKGNQYLYLRRESGYVHDPFKHELILAIREEGGMVIFTGCSHSGALNMVKTVVDRFPDVPVKAVVGGFHLIGGPIFKAMGGSKAEVQAIGSEMLTYPVDCYYTGHCTGEKAYSVLKDVMGDRLRPVSTGVEIDV